MRAKSIISAIVLVSVLAVPAADVEACSRALWTTKAGQVFVGRTQDWTEKANSTLRKFPRGQERVSPIAENPLRWTSKYGSLVITGYDIGTHEGVNEQGLSAHLLFLAGDTDFGTRDPRRPGLNILQWVQYFLDNYATVAEAVEAMRTSDLQIVPVVLPNGRESMLHLSLEDKTGDSSVLEYTGGKLNLYHDRRFTVMTNEPTYDKQIENLKQYRSFGGDKPLPGERTPSDRFVRAAYYVNALPEPANRDVGAAYILSVMRNVSVPFGAADPDKPNVANTIFRTVIDLTGGRYFFESTFAPNVVWVDYDKLDFSEGSQELALAVESRIFSLNGNVTGQLEDAKPFVFGGSH
ncbi:MAG: linear amide C-N hydrolase [Hyphomicrobium sp.]|uniref:linear amide C-N hydrolase n=1 Tax=Hyphomicrobium sp. TaxID=82 RepID=UPI003D1137CA